MYKREGRTKIVMNDEEQVEPSTEYQGDDVDKAETEGLTVWATFLALGLMLILVILVVATLATLIASLVFLALTHQVLLSFVILNISVLLAVFFVFFFLKTQKWWNVDFAPSKPITLAALLASPQVNRSSSALKQPAQLNLKSARRFALDTDKPERRAIVSSPTGDFEIRLVSVYLKPLPLAKAATLPSNQGGEGGCSPTPKPKSIQAKQPLVIEMEVRKAGSQFMRIKTDTSQLPYALTLEQWDFSILKAWPTSASASASSGFQHYGVQIVGNKISKEIEV